MSVPTSTPTEPVDDAATNPIVGALRSYVQRVRGGDTGSLPAVLGLAALLVFFSAMQSDVFPTARNLANLPGQSAGVMFIAMGLVFVLLLGEIDLGAGVTGGTSAAVLAVLLTKHEVSWPLTVAACIATGLVIGLVVGLLVAWLGIPSFVVTLAFFLGLQGVMLLVIGEGGTIGIGEGVVRSVNNDNMKPVYGWIMVAVVVIGYAASAFAGAARRARAGLSAAPMPVLIAKIVSLAVVMSLVTAFLNQERSPNAVVKSLKGVPVVIPFTIVFVVGLTFLLSRTAFGRHVYAVGGNAEAARRAGINVASIRIACFMISSAMAAIGGILIASRDNSVSPTTGVGTTLLLAVAAAVIGGTSLFGGRGRIIDAVLGGLVVGVINNGLPFITQRSGVQYMVTALVLLLAASVDAITRRTTSATGR
ncbi:MAG: ABC transporter permease [Kineosporiaceae bacterium]